MSYYKFGLGAGATGILQKPLWSFSGEAKAMPTRVRDNCYLIV